MVDQIDKILDRAERYLEAGEVETARKLTEEAYRLEMARTAHEVPIFLDGSKIVANVITADKIVAGKVLSDKIRKF